MAYQSTITTDCRCRAITMVLILSLSVHYSHRFQPQSYHDATYSGGSICESGLSVHKLQAQSYHYATYSGGSLVKVARLSTTVADCSNRAIMMLLILVEISVKVACWSTTTTVHRLQAQCYHHATYYLWKWTVGQRQPQTATTELSPFWQKYPWKLLVGPREPRLQAQSYHHTTYSDGSICKVACQSRLFQATDCKHRAITMLNILMVKVSCLSITATACSHRATILFYWKYLLKLSRTTTDCKHRAITTLLLLEVSVKVACQSITATDWSHRAIYHDPTYSGGSICESGLSARTTTDCKHTILVEVCL